MNEVDLQALSPEQKSVFHLASVLKGEAIRQAKMLGMPPRLCLVSLELAFMSAILELSKDGMAAVGVRSVADHFITLAEMIENGSFDSLPPIEGDEQDSS